MVYPRQHVPRLEEKWLIIMGPWKSYASLALSIFVFINRFLDFAAGAGKSILWCVVSCFIIWQRIHILDKFCYYRGHQGDARGQTSTYGILLL